MNKLSSTAKALIPLKGVLKRVPSFFRMGLDFELNCKGELKNDESINIYF